ncbi:hypothetical protein ACFZCY_18870 [Streptomyces sp. NPDC007983]|uniref:hypothetical protein n=1 Tax=Streptomyces sp. NPDC007983 TaxID=3364800 RepID=UPI0036E24800
MSTQSINGEIVASLGGVTMSVIDPATGPLGAAVHVPGGGPGGPGHGRAFGAGSPEELSAKKSVWTKVGAP